MLWFKYGDVNFNLVVFDYIELSRQTSKNKQTDKSISNNNQNSGKLLAMLTLNADCNRLIKACL